MYVHLSVCHLCLYICSSICLSSLFVYMFIYLSVIFVCIYCSSICLSSLFVYMFIYLSVIFVCIYMFIYLSVCLIYLLHLVFLQTFGDEMLGETGLVISCILVVVITFGSCHASLIDASRYVIKSSLSVKVNRIIMPSGSYL